jgi:hypothetical protein
MSYQINKYIIMRPKFSQLVKAAASGPGAENSLKNGCPEGPLNIMPIIN